MGNRKVRGARQRIWTILCSAKEPLSRVEIANMVQTEPETVSRYLNALLVQDYVHSEKTKWTLVKKTGPLAPVASASGNFRDLNLDPPPRPEDLKKAIKDSGLSLNAWALQNGLGKGMSTRLRAMMNGSRPIGPSVEKILNGEK